MSADVYSFVGHADSGKTTFLCGLVRFLSDHGYRVAVLKHTSHDEAFFLRQDGKGKDTDRMFYAGAATVALSGPSGYSLVARMPEPDPREMVGLLPPADFVFTEGYKQGPFQKIEVSLSGEKVSLVLPEEGRMALVTCVADQWEDRFPIDRPAVLAEHLIRLREARHGHHG